METDEPESKDKQKATVQVPKTFHFGHHATRGFSKQKKSVLESDKMLDELKESLPET